MFASSGSTEYRALHPRQTTYLPPLGSHGGQWRYDWWTGTPDDPWCTDFKLGDRLYGYPDFQLSDASSVRVAVHKSRHGPSICAG
jgi:hypothetical protein